MKAIREEYGSMPVQVQAFCLDVMKILESG